MTTARAGAGERWRSKTPTSWIRIYDLKGTGTRRGDYLARWYYYYLNFLISTFKLMSQLRNKPQNPFATSLSFLATIFLILNLQFCHAEIIDIQVGLRDDNLQLVFTPEVVYQKVGQQVRFQFYPQNHSVAQSSFENPCQPLGGASSSAGFFSGFNPVKSIDQNMPTFTINISSTEPIYFYCAQGRHCQSGMVGIINPPNSDTISAFKAAASDVPFTLVPLAPPTQDLPSPKFSTTAVIVPGATNGADPQYTPNAPPAKESNNSSGGLSTSGYIAVAGVGVLLLGLAAVVTWCTVIRRRQRRERAKRRADHQDRERRRQRGKDVAPRSPHHVYRDVDGGAQMIDLEALRVDSSPQLAYAYSFTRPSVASGTNRRSSLLVQRPLSHVSPTTSVPDRRFSANMGPVDYRSRSSMASTYQHHRLSMPHTQSVRMSYQGPPSTSHSRQVPSRRYSTMSIPVPVPHSNRQSMLRKPSPTQLAIYEEMQKAKGEAAQKKENRKSKQPSPSPAPTNRSTPTPTVPKGKWKIFKKSTYRRRIEVREIDIHDENRHKASVSGATRKPTPSMILSAAAQSNGASTSGSAQSASATNEGDASTRAATVESGRDIHTRGNTSYTADSREMRGGGSVAS